MDLFVVFDPGLGADGLGIFTMDWPGARLDQSICALKSKSSLALSRSLAYHAEAQHTIAEMVLELESIGPRLEAITAV